MNRTPVVKNDIKHIIWASNLFKEDKQNDSDFSELIDSDSFHITFLAASPFSVRL